MSWSLHKYFQPKAASTAAAAASAEALPLPGAEEALPLPSRGGAALAAEQAAEKEAAQAALQLVPAKASHLVQQPANRSQRQRGGWPRKAPGQAKGRYLKKQTAMQKLQWVEWLVMHQQQSGSLHVALAEAAKRIGCQFKTVKAGAAGRQAAGN